MASAAKRIRPIRPPGSRRAEHLKRKNKKRGNMFTWLPLRRRRVNGKTSWSADRQKHFAFCWARKRNCLPEVVAGVFLHAEEIRQARSEPRRDLACVKACKWLCEISDKISVPDVSSAKGVLSSLNDIVWLMCVYGRESRVVEYVRVCRATIF